MDYNKYKEIAKDVTIDTALPVVQALLEQAQADAVEHDAKVKELTQQVEDAKGKYNDLQVDYIRRFTTASKADDEVNDPEETTAEQVEKEIETLINV